MALIKCKNCNGEISDKSTKCVHCGMDTQYSITHICPECGKEYDNSICKNCGYHNKEKPISNTSLSSNRGFNGWGLIISLIIGITTFIVIQIIDGVIIVSVVMAVILFIVSLGGFYGFLEDLTDSLDDINASTNRDPYKRAMYRQIKKNNKK